MILLRVNTPNLTKANSNDWLLTQINCSHVNSEENDYRLG